jgi:hypothetical protein
VLKQYEVSEFPIWLMAEVIVIASSPELYANKTDLVQTLISQIKNYDPYAGSGCFDTSVGAETIGKTIRQIMQQ